MNKRFLLGMLVASATTLGLTSCSKNDSNSAVTMTIEEAAPKALTDFVNVLGEPLYADFVIKASALNDAVIRLATNPSVENQTAAQQAWINTRVVWEQSEGFLLGPVEDDNYDPYMDTWPTDVNQMKDLLNGTSDIATLLATPTAETDEGTEYALRGFHPLEYLLWDLDPSKYTQRDSAYMTALSKDILTQTQNLQNSWTKSGGYANELMNPGASGSRYTSKEEALEDIALQLIAICDEVGDSKIPKPFGTSKATADSTQTESPYSHNSITDFKNNIQGAYNSYTCSYNNTSGTSLSTIVSINNGSLDIKIKTAFSNAINSFKALDGVTFEKAIYDNRPAVQGVIDNINALRTILNEELIPYIQTYVKD